MNSLQTERDRSVVLDVVERIADRDGVAATDLPPLATVVDPELLVGIVAESATDSDVYVEFEYEGYRVTVDGDGEVSIGDENTARGDGIG